MNCTKCGDPVRTPNQKGLCDHHLEETVADDYPQGWRHYPGDVCPHGKYVGGVGWDRMCQRCELGE